MITPIKTNFRGIIAYCQEALQTTHPEDHPNYERLVGIILIPIGFGSISDQ